MKKDRLNDFIGLRCTSDDRDRLQSHADGMCESLSAAILSLALSQLEYFEKPLKERELNNRIRLESEGMTSVPDHKFQEIIRNVKNFDAMIDMMFKLDPNTLSFYAEISLRAVAANDHIDSISGILYVADKLAEVRRSGKLDEKQTQNEAKFTFGCLDELHEEVKNESIQEVEEVIKGDAIEEKKVRTEEEDEADMRLASFMQERAETKPYLSND